MPLLSERRYRFRDLVWVDGRGRALAQLRRRRVERMLGSRVLTPGIYYDYVGQVRLRRWSFGRVVLAGDACQSTSPLAEDGASSALNGASVLADALLKASSLEVALAKYEGAVKPVIEERPAVDLRAAPWLLPASNWRLAMRNLIVRMANRSGMG